MKATGIVREMDGLGRLVIPIELRRTMKLKEGDPFEIFVNSDGSIVIKKYEPSCIFCGESKGVFSFKDRNVCAGCAKDLNK